MLRSVRTLLTLPLSLTPAPHPVAETASRIRPKTSRRRTCALIVGLALTTAGAAIAAPGEPDLTFGPGLVLTPVAPNGSAIANSVATDGSRLVVGGACNRMFITANRDPVFCVSRHLANGQLDPSFGTSGVVFTSIGSTDADAGIHAVAVQSDRKIVATGFCYSTATGVDVLCAARYNIDGSLDSSFANGGRWISSIELIDSSIALQNDGKIVVGGSCVLGTPRRTEFCAARLLSSGSLDTEFGNNGIVTTSIGVADALARQVRLQADGRIVLAGECWGSQSARLFCAARYQSNGALDTSFDSDGKVLVQVDQSSDSASAVAIQTNGKIVLAGVCINAASQSRYCVARLNADGQIDPGFGIGGKRVIAHPAATGFGHGAENVHINADGTVLLTGYCRPAAIQTACAFRLTAAGSLDDEYGDQGVATIVRGVWFGDSVIASDGKLVLAGSCTISSQWQFCLARFNADGSTDTSLNGGGSGIARTRIGTAQSYGWASVEQPDRKIVMAGFCQDTGDSVQFCLARYLPNGTPDTSFGAAGTIRADITPGDDSAMAVAIQRDGKIVATGTCGPAASSDFCAARFHPNGAIDTSFGIGGKMSTSMADGADAVRAMTIQPNGSILMAGFCQSLSSGTGYDFCMARLLPNGQLDTTFNSTGKVITNIASGFDYANAMLLQPDGKIVLLGGCYVVSFNYDFCMARYNSNGSLDQNFGGAGRVSYAIGALDDTAVSAALQPDGKIVAAGFCFNGANNDFCLARFQANAELDTQFGFSGRAYLAVGPGSDIIHGVAIQKDGKIVVGGECESGTNVDFCVARLNPDGTLDLTFASTGRTLIPIGLGNDGNRSMVLQRDGNILLAGDCVAGTTHEFCMARVQGGPDNFLSCSPDVDDDGAITATTDALIVSRVMRGVTGSAVINGIQFAAHARRTQWGTGSAADIRMYLNTHCSMAIPY